MASKTISKNRKENNKGRERTHIFYPNKFSFILLYYQKKFKTPLRRIQNYNKENVRKLYNYYISCRRTNSKGKTFILETQSENR